jgi:cardiolipin synthase C
MQNKKPTLTKFMFLFPLVVLALAQAPASVSHAQSLACRQAVTPVLGASGSRNIFGLDDNDRASAVRRQGLYFRFKQILFGDKYKTIETDDQDLQDLKTLMKKREFSTWFRFSDEVQHNISNKIADNEAMIKAVNSPQEGFLAKLMMIRQAKYTVDVAYYIYAHDNAGLSLNYELKEAIRRGVSVRIMVDSLGSMEGTLRGNPHLKALLTYARQNAGYMKDASGRPTSVRATAEVVVFNPATNIPSLIRDGYVKIANFFRIKLAKDPAKVKLLATTGWNPNRRSHDKVIVADAEFPELTVAMIGGANIAVRYFELDPRDHENFVDGELLVRNSPKNYKSSNPYRSIGEIINEHYDRLYFYRSNRRLMEGIVGLTLGRDKKIGEMRRSYDQINEITENTQRQLGESMDSPDFGKKYLTTGFTENKINFFTTIENLTRNLFELAKAVNKDEMGDLGELNAQSILGAMQKNILQEKEEITLVSPYLWLSDTDLVFLKTWLKEDPKRRLNVYSNSVITSDNPPAQAIVDVVTAPRLMMDAEIRDQVSFYEYGRADDVNLGGTKYYGKLHLKAAYFKSQKIAMLMTYNKDPRSQYLNSEMALQAQGPYFYDLLNTIQGIHENSHLWGSPEYQQIRTSPTLSKIKKLTIKNQARLIWFLETFHLLFLI